MHAGVACAAAVVIARSRDLLERVMIDGRGKIVGGQLVGGNGGILSCETMRSAEQLARALGEFDASLERGGE